MEHVRPVPDTDGAPPAGAPSRGDAARLAGLLGRAALGDQVAFAAIPKKDLNALLKDKKALTAVLTHHVVGERLDPSMVAGEHETLNKDMLTVEGEGENFTIGDATVVCGNVQTANATVYVVDQVLMPQM